MGSKRTRRLLAAAGCIAIVSLVAPVAAQAAEAGTIAPTLTGESVESASARFVGDPPPAQVNVPMHHQFTFTGDATAITVSHLPAGLRMDYSGLLTGVPTVADPDGKILLSAFDWNTDQQVEQWVPLPVAEPERPVISNPLAAASADEPYAHEVQVTTPADTSLSLTATGLPEGYSMTPDGVVTGKIDGKPGSYPVTITATAQPELPGRVAVSSSVSWTLEVAEPERPVLAGITLPRVTHGTPFSYQVSAKAPAARPWLTFTASGLPHGLSMTPDGLISGTTDYSKTGTYSVTIGVTAHSPGMTPVAGDSVTVTLEARGPNWFDDLGRYHEILFDGSYTALPADKLVNGDCPGGMWLDNRTGTAGRNVGRGFVVDTNESFTTFNKSGLPRYRTHPSGRAASGLDIRVSIDWIGDPWTFVRMTCTADPAFAWDGK